MTMKTASKDGFTVNAYQGDAKTLLAFNLTQAKTARLAGFTLQYSAGGHGPFFIWNQLQFKKPADHAQVAGEPPNSSVNAPIHKLRWVHIPGSFHQGLKPFRGLYSYTVTPRYFDTHAKLLPLDPALSLSVDINVVPFQKQGLRLGFCRGFTQSQAFVHHFGIKTKLQPTPRTLVYDTSAVCGTNPAGHTFTYDEAYEWLGFTAREMIFEILDEVRADTGLHLDVFAYDLNEPGIAAALLDLAAQGRVRIISDSADLHHDKTPPANPAKVTMEDRFQSAFNLAVKLPAALKRGKFGRYAHDKILIVSDATGPRKVLTGSTNFSVTGVYVNSNHVLVFDDPAVASLYAQVFQSAWDHDVKAPAFRNSTFAAQAFDLTSAKTPKASVNFSPHNDGVAQDILDALAQRIVDEGQDPKGNVLFAVMQLDNGTGPVFPALRDLHAQQTAFTFGISDSPGGISLYKVGSLDGVLVTGRPSNTQLPPPFDQVPGVGIGHQVHHKFVVCGFNGAKPVVYCGSSNLALAGEEANGDNLIAIEDGDVATAFAIEGLALVDHFNFLDRFAKDDSGAPTPHPPTTPQDAAVNAGWFLGTSNAWVKPYYDTQDLHCADRLLFGS
jgi:hypothetical protein